MRALGKLMALSAAAAVFALPPARAEGPAASQKKVLGLDTVIHFFEDYPDLTKPATIYVAFMRNLSAMPQPEIHRPMLHKLWPA